jgi:hypothetical protein
MVTHAILAFERHVFRVTASITLFRQEDDGDLHLVLRDPKDRGGSVAELCR